MTPPGIVRCDGVMTTTPRSSPARRVIGALLTAAAVGALTTTGLADAAPDGADTTFVPITPCRLFDTRPGTDNVGDRSAPLGADDTHVVQVTGRNGDCDIPTSATAVAFNATAAGATAASFVTFWPADVDRPLSSNLNVTAGAPPTPNKVDVALAADGSVAMYNLTGSLHLLADVTGYYTTDTVDEILARVAALEHGASGSVDGGGGDTASAAQLAALEARVTELETLLAHVSLDDVDGVPTMAFSGVNVRVDNGTGSTDGDPNGSGNLIVGYAEDVDASGVANRSGSHNLVLGIDHGWSSFGGLVTGVDNDVTGPHASAIGGARHTVSGSRSVVLGGHLTQSSGAGSVTAAGTQTVMSGSFAASVAGIRNEVPGSYGVAIAGHDNVVDAGHAATIGGDHNVTSGIGAVAVGGASNEVSGPVAVAIAGAEHVVSGFRAAVLGGRNHGIDGGYAVAVGRRDAVVDGGYATAVGTSNVEVGYGAVAVGEWDRDCGFDQRCVRTTNGTTPTSVLVLHDGTSGDVAGVATSRLGPGEYQVVFERESFGDVAMGRSPHVLTTPRCPAAVGIQSLQSALLGTSVGSVTVRFIVQDTTGVVVDCPVDVALVFEQP